MRPVKLPRPFRGTRPARPKQEAATERISGDGQRPALEKVSAGASAWLLKHKLVWLLFVAFGIIGLGLTPIASFVVTQAGGGALVNAGLALVVVSLLLVVKRHGETQRQQAVQYAQALQTSYAALVQVLQAALDRPDPATLEHSDRVSDLTALLARELGLRKQELRDITFAATLHDIGKIGVADAALSKPGPLSGEEWEEMRKHPRMGYEMLKGIDFLQGAAEIVYAHHERYDGTGYPHRLAGVSIPLGARIFAVVDAFDAMTSERPYRRAKSHEEAIQEIVNQAGTQFDPKVVGVFLKANAKGLIRYGNGERLEMDTLRDLPKAD